MFSGICLHLTMFDGVDVQQLCLLTSRVQSSMIFLSSHLLFLQYILHSVSSPLPPCRLFVTVCWQLATSWELSTKGWRRRSSEHRRRNWPGRPRVLTQRSSSPALSGGRGWGIPRNTYYSNTLTYQDPLTKVLVLMSSLVVILCYITPTVTCRIN